MPPTPGGCGNRTSATIIGTAAVPFQALTEHDRLGEQAYQSISMQQDYKDKSFEELRLEDYIMKQDIVQKLRAASDFTPELFQQHAQMTSEPRKYS